MVGESFVVGGVLTCRTAGVAPTTLPRIWYLARGSARFEAWIAVGKLVGLLSLGGVVLSIRAIL